MEKYVKSDNNFYQKDNEKKVIVLEAGETWLISETTKMDVLVIAKNATITVPDGYSLTMTVNNVGTVIKQGTYEGNIVLSVTENITENSVTFRTGIYIEDGAYVAEKSVAAIVASGTVTDTSANDVHITSNEGKFDGIIVNGDSKYTIINPVIDLSGNGGDDWTGYGTAIMSTGNSDVTVYNAKISGTGYNRCAFFAGGNSTLHVNNSEIEVYNGILNSNPTFLDKKVKSMLIGPWLFGVVGRVRATNVVENATVYYNNTHIKAQQWGALSTDNPTKLRLYATNCLIETVESGYGAYAIGDCLDYFSGCTFNVVDYGLILCDYASGTFTDGCVVNSKKIGVMMHDGSGGSILTIDKGSVLNTKSTVIQIKGRRGANIIADNAELNSESGIILQTMPNDDPNMSSWDYSGGDQSYSRDVTATFSNMELNGDFINGFTASGAVSVTLKNATLTGAITTATTEHPLFNNEEITSDTPEFYYLLGEINNTYCATDGPYGISASLDANSKWVVETTSYLTALSIEEGAIITAPKGYTVTMTIDDIATEIKSGTYEGKIVLTVTKS